MAAERRPLFDRPLQKDWIVTVVALLSAYVAYSGSVAIRQDPGAIELYLGTLVALAVTFVLFGYLPAVFRRSRRETQSLLKTFDEEQPRTR